MAVLGLLAAASLVHGCADASDVAPSCNVDADCASGVCLPDRSCGSVDGGASDAGTDTDGGATDPDGGSVATTDGGSPAACGNGDGVVTRSELLFRAGLAANFRIAQNATVNLAGTSWDVSTMQAGDADVKVVLEAATGRWFSDEFPDATYASKLSSSSDLLGVFQATNDALLLLGVVSPEKTGLYTDVKYDPPVKVLQFPLRVGAQWSTSSSVTGSYLGLLVYYVEQYDSRVDKSGTVKTPYGTFPVLRVRTDYRKTVGTLPTSSKQVAFVSECYGVVASMQSRDYESSDDFTMASELRRLAP